MTGNTPVHVLLHACGDFENRLKFFIKNTRNKDAAYMAAQCLFDVRRLEGALERVARNGGGRQSRGMTADPAGIPVKVIQPVDREEL